MSGLDFTVLSGLSVSDIIQISILTSACAYHKTHSTCFISSFELALLVWPCARPILHRNQALPPHLLFPSSAEATASIPQSLCISLLPISRFLSRFHIGFHSPLLRFRICFGLSNCRDPTKQGEEQKLLKIQALLTVVFSRLNDIRSASRGDYFLHALEFGLSLVLLQSMCLYRYRQRHNLIGTMSWYLIASFQLIQILEPAQHDRFARLFNLASKKNFVEDGINLDRFIPSR